MLVLPDTQSGLHGPTKDQFLVTWHPVRNQNPKSIVSQCFGKDSALQIPSSYLFQTSFCPHKLQPQPGLHLHSTISDFQVVATSGCLSDRLALSLLTQCVSPHKPWRCLQVDIFSPIKPARPWFLHSVVSPRLRSYITLLRSVIHC